MVALNQRHRHPKRLPAAAVLVALFLLAAPFCAWASGSSADNKDSEPGAAAYKTKCLTCHAQDGSGNTAVGKSLKSADLRTSVVQAKSDAELADFIAAGKGNMPSFKNSTPPDEIQAIVKYIRGFDAKKSASSKKSKTAE